MAKEELFSAEQQTLEEQMTTEVNQLFHDDDWRGEANGEFESRQKNFLGIKKEDGAFVIVYQRRDSSTLNIVSNVVSMTGKDPMLVWKPADRIYEDKPHREGK